MADCAASTSDGNPRALKRPNTGAEQTAAAAAEKRAHPEPPSVSHSDTDIVDLNVGGAPRTVLRATLRRHEESMIAVMFDAAKEWTFARKDGVIFLDRDPKAFDAVLRFLRTGYVDYTGDAAWDAVIDAELEYWGLVMPEPEPDVVDVTPTRKPKKYERSTTYTIPGGVRDGYIEFMGIAPPDQVDDVVDRVASLIESTSWPAFPTHPDTRTFTTLVVGRMPSSVHFCDVHFYSTGKPAHNTPPGMENKVMYFNMMHSASKTKAFLRVILK